MHAYMHACRVVILQSSQAGLLYGKLAHWACVSQGCYCSDRLMSRKNLMRRKSGNAPSPCHAGGVGVSLCFLPSTCMRLDRTYFFGFNFDVCIPEVLSTRFCYRFSLFHDVIWLKNVSSIAGPLGELTSLISTLRPSDMPSVSNSCIDAEVLKRS